jgi:hypothetical protein
MASPTSAKPLSISLSAQNFVPESEERGQTTFLSLAPATSVFYPTSSPSKAQAPEALPAGITTNTTLATAAEIEAELLKTRRSSSLSSDATTQSGAVRKRFLKLGPVHGRIGEGGDGDWDGDWSEDIVAV